MVKMDFTWPNGPSGSLIMLLAVRCGFYRASCCWGSGLVLECPVPIWFLIEDKNARCSWTGLSPKSFRAPAARVPHDEIKDPKRNMKASDLSQAQTVLTHQSLRPHLKTPRRPGFSLMLNRGTRLPYLDWGAELFGHIPEKLAETRFHELLVHAGTRANLRVQARLQTNGMEWQGMARPLQLAPSSTCD